MNKSSLMESSCSIPSCSAGKDQEMDQESSCCIGCLSSYNQTCLHTYPIQNESLRQILEEDYLLLCNECHVQALQVDKWVTTVQNNQFHLAQTQTDASGVTESTQKLNSWIAQPTKKCRIGSDLSTSTKCNEPSEILAPQSMTDDSKHQRSIIIDELEIKQEKLDSDESLADPLENENDIDEAPNTLEVVNIKVEKFSDDEHLDTEEMCTNEKVTNENSIKEGSTPKRTPQKRKVNKESSAKKNNVSGGNIEEGNDDLEETENEKRLDMYEVVKITKEQCLEERAALAKDPKYLETAFRCTNCLKGYILKSGYEEHMKLHEPSRGDHICEICKVRYSTLKAVCKHIRKHFVKAKCRECDFLRKNPSSVVEHYQKEHKKQTNECEQCGKKLATLKSLKRHQQYVHTGVTERERLTCTYCSNTFKCKYILKNHITKMHTQLVSAAGFDIDRHKCPQCPRGFSVPSRLQRHIKLAHTTVTDFRCEQCDKFFKSKHSLIYHEKFDPTHVYKNKMPFQCDHCGRRFKRKIHTQKHILGMHPFVAKLPLPLLTCTLCNKEYKGEQGLHFHMRAVHGQGLQRKHRPKEQRECHFCHKTFMGEKWLNNHIRKTHERGCEGEGAGGGVNPADMVETQLGAE